MSGLLSGIGVGPGDPDLITLKALKALQGAQVVAYPAPPEGVSLARSIAAPHFPGGQEEIAIRMPLEPNRFPAAEVYDEAAATLGVRLDAGRDVAVLCEGDPFVYGSFLYLFERLAQSHRVEVIPGVSSPMACAAALGLPLAARNDVLTVVPAPLDDQRLTAQLANCDAAAIVKVGRHLEKVRRVLDGLGLLQRAHYVERASMATQRSLAAGRGRAARALLLHGHRPQAGRGMALSPPAVVILDARQVALARRIAAALPGAAVHGPASLRDDADVAYERLGPHLVALFRAGTPIVGICAAGILIRLLSPHLADKGAEPPVLAVSDDGRSVVPLLGGHHGANRLARTIASALGAHAAITTAGDTALGFALDAPPPGWQLGEGARVKAVTAALLAGEPVRLVNKTVSADWLTAGDAPFADRGRLTLHITDRRVVPSDDDGRCDAASRRPGPRLGVRARLRAR